MTTSGEWFLLGCTLLIAVLLAISNRFPPDPPQAPIGAP